MPELDAAIKNIQRNDFAKFKELAAELALVEAGCDPQAAPAKKSRVYDVTLASAFFEGTTAVHSVEELLECAEMAQMFAAYASGSCRGTTDVRDATTHEQQAAESIAPSLDDPIVHGGIAVSIAYNFAVMYFLQKKIKKRKKRPLAVRKSTKVKAHRLSSMSVRRPYCAALHFVEELPKPRKKEDGYSFNNCCRNGAINLPSVGDGFPVELQQLLMHQHELSPAFLSKIRNYNSAMSFASINCQQDWSVRGTGGPYCFRIHGKVYSLFHTSAHPADNAQPRYAQLYVLDSAEVTDVRMNEPSNVDTSREIMECLDLIMRGCNPYADAYRMLREVEEADTQRLREQSNYTEDQAPELRLLFRLNPSVDRRTYNVPASNEVAAVFRTTADGEIPPADIIVQSKSGDYLRLSTLSPNLDPMTYPLFFPTGTRGWSPYMPLLREIAGRKFISRREYLSYIMQVRRDDEGALTFNPLHYGGKLFQEFCVVNYAHVESDRMAWFRSHQEEIKADNYTGLHVSFPLETRF